MRTTPLRWIALVLALTAAPQAVALADGGHDHGPPSVMPAADVNDPDTWAHPGHPSYTSTFDPTRADRYAVDSLAGCRVDHPYIAWLTEATKQRFETDLRTLEDALEQGYHPISPVPNEWLYPDTYWHWIRATDSVAEKRDESSPEPWKTRDTYVNPANIEWLLMVPAAKLRNHPEAGIHLEDQGRLSEAWVPGGALYYLPRSDTKRLELYQGCEPMHDHPDNQGVDQPHIHLWPYHDVHPLAFNPEHMCTADGKAEPSRWPSRSTAYRYCLYSDDHPPEEQH
jgi:hypothetical protein